MRARFHCLLLTCSIVLWLLTDSVASAGNITISGAVRSTGGAPIHRIKVTVYRDDREVDHVFTAEDGKYAIEVPEGKPVAIRFDTHPSLTNANEWHPSVIANVDATSAIKVDRALLRVGDGDSHATFIDALSGYQYGALWEEMEPNRAYAASAAYRLGPMKLVPPILHDFRTRLQQHFEERARRP